MPYLWERLARLDCSRAKPTLLQTIVPCCYHRRMIPRDTERAAFDAQLAALRRLGPEGRLRLGIQLSEDARRIAVEGERRRHPEYSEAEARRAVARAILGEELASKVWGAPPRR